ncbi:TorF family putative porin [Undibacterium sp. TS12]|uniref:TorF family putative porin n=1 Tax=Undibacterium sp. TS12 TaxID=2908202 RepID=UPI001F4D14FD|nr:TorF family putative porin [Undibacterium sp. TS12]MCH8618016.1 TorF family putative porin [Undibacterium sp. TS12]
MKKLVIAAAVATTFLGGFAQAEDAKPEAKPDNEVSFNIGLASEYRYRAIAQSRMDPALQGGADYTHNPSGFYAGTWLSTIKWTKDAGGGGDIEWDLYAGKKGEIVKDVSYDVGVLSYVYPSNGLNKVPGFVDANTTEIYGQIGTGPVYAKYSHSVTNLFGFVNSKNSGYLDLGANIELPEGYTLGLHVGRQTIKNNGAYSYSDWKVGVNKEFFGVNFGLAALGTNADSKLYVTPAGKFTGKTTLVLTAVKTF